MNNFFENLKSIVLGLAVAVIFPLTIHLITKIIQPYGIYESLENYIDKETLAKHEGFYEKTRKLESEERVLLQQASYDLSAKKRLGEVQKELKSLKEFYEKEVAVPYKEGKIKWVTARDRSWKFLFYTRTIIGLLGIIVGSMMRVSFLGTGFILGGISLLTWSYAWNWDRLHDLFKLITLIIALIFIIVIGYNVIVPKGQKR